MEFNLGTVNPGLVLLGESLQLPGKFVIDFLIAYPLLGYPVFVVVMSVTAFLVYGWDKRQAKTGGWRVPERRLHGLAFLGGWPGAMFGQSYFRHKTQKSEFKIVTWLAAGLHAALVVWYLYRQFTS